MAKNCALFGLFSRVREFRIDERMVAMGDAWTLRQPMRAVGEVAPFFGESEEMALVHSIFGAACQFDRLCRVPSIIAFFGHDQSR